MNIFILDANPEVAAAMGLAQLEKVDWFVDLRMKMAQKYRNAIAETNCDWLHAQAVPINDESCYYTFAMKYSHPEKKWEDFRLEYIKNGGDGIYAAWALCYLEDSVDDIQNRLLLMGLDGKFNTEYGQCPVAESTQPKLMQLTTNQKNETEMDIQANALRKTIESFSGPS